MTTRRRVGAGVALASLLAAVGTGWSVHPAAAESASTAGCTALPYGFFSWNMPYNTLTLHSLSYVTQNGTMYCVGTGVTGASWGTTYGYQSVNGVGGAAGNCAVSTGWGPNDAPRLFVGPVFIEYGFEGGVSDTPSGYTQMGLAVADPAMGRLTCQEAPITVTPYPPFVSTPDGNILYTGEYATGDSVADGTFP